jgi:hypothetical protein
VTQLRRFGAEFKLIDRSQSNAEWGQLTTAMPKDDRKAQDAAWVQYIQKSEERRNRHQSEFDVRFRPGIISYKDEICKREEFINPCPRDIRLSLLNTGMLAGPDPIADFADYLALIIGNLPESN